MNLPIQYRWLKANGFEGFAPWYLLEEPVRDGLRTEYRIETGEDFYPFARRQDCDDVAGFAVVDGQIQPAVVSAHLTWIGKREKPGFPRRAVFEDMYEWLIREVIPATRDWMSEEELESFANDKSRVR